MRLHIIGTGCPDPRRERYGSSILLELDDPDRLAMIDCGPAATYKMACMGIRPTRVSHLFLTHHHFDHNGDVPCFALTRWDQSGPVAEPLPIIGPPPTTDFVERLFGPEGALQPDWYARLELPASKYLHQQRGGRLPRPAPEFAVTEAMEGVVASSDSWEATAVRVHHCEPWLQSVAFRFATAEGTVVFTGDAGACPAIDQLAAEADVLVVCCAYVDSPGMSSDVAHCVTGSEDCARLAALSKAHTIVLTHTTGGVDPEQRRRQVVDRIQSQTQAQVIFADELTTIDIPAGGPASVLGPVTG